MRVVRELAAAVTAALALGIGGMSASAAVPVPVPATPLPVTLDTAAGYEPQTICDPTARPGSTALKDLLLATYGPATVYIPRACAAGTSEHYDGRAVDWMRSARVPAEKAMADAFVAWLLAPDADGTPHAMARRLGVMYVIWDNRMIRMYDPGRGWTEYRGCLDAANAGAGMDTTCHRNHVHLSLSWDGAAAFTSWWTGTALTRSACRAGSTSADPGQGEPQVLDGSSGAAGLVEVPAEPVLDTAAGSGAGLSGSCRLPSGRVLYPSVAGAVPEGVRAVALRVSSTSNAPARLAVWSSGSVRPTGQVSTPIGRTTTATVLVPVASDGTVALATSLGAASLRVEVVGYATGEVTVPPPPTTTPPVATAPGKPRTVRASSPARRTVRTTWRAPRTDGGATITGYRVQALTSARKGARAAGSCTVGAQRRSCTITGLTRGRTYWMSVSVSNEAGRTWAARRSVRVR